MNGTVLLADTNASLCEMLGHLLRLRGFETISAADGAEALAAAGGRELVAAVLDLHLPGASGFEVCRALCDQQPNVPVWITSAGRHPATAVRAKAAGARELLRKPFRPTDVCRQIERELARDRRQAMLTPQLI